jgi:hypothetical protein
MALALKVEHFRNGVIRDLVEPVLASPAMSAMPSKAEVIQSIGDSTTSHCGLMVLPRIAFLRLALSAFHQAHADPHLAIR